MDKNVKIQIDQKFEQRKIKRLNNKYNKQM